MKAPLHVKAPLLAVLALIPLLSGCAGLVAGTGVGFLISQQTLPNETIATVRVDVDEVWPSARETLSFFRDPGTEVEIQDYPRVAKAEVGDAKVTLTVEALDIDRTMIRVRAEKYLTSDGDTAQRVISEILDRLPQE